MKNKHKPYYYIIWIEGFECRTGEKIKSILNRRIQYTTKMTEAMRILPDDVEEMKSILLDMGIAKWVVDGNTFIKTNYAPKGSIFKV